MSDKTTQDKNAGWSEGMKAHAEWMRSIGKKNGVEVSDEQVIENWNKMVANASASLGESMAKTAAHDESDDEEEEESETEEGYDEGEEDYCNGCDTDVTASTMFNHDDINLCPKCNENKPELIPAGCGCVLCGDDEDLEPLEFDGEKLLFIGLTSGKVFRQTEDAGDVLIGIAGQGRFKDVKIPTAPSETDDFRRFLAIIHPADD